jgi:hypothetical protein
MEILRSACPMFLNEPLWRTAQRELLLIYARPEWKAFASDIRSLGERLSGNRTILAPTGWHCRACFLLDGRRGF